MFRSVLVPLDGSEFAAQALPLGSHIAKLTGATLDLIMVHQSLPQWYSLEGGVGDMSAFEQLARERQNIYLEKVAGETREAGSVPVTANLVEGEVSTAISQFVEERGVDLVVMTSHGRSGLPRLWLGSVADKLVRSLGIPVLVTRPNPRVPATNLRRILVPLDGSRLAESILEDARIIARVANAEIVLNMIIEPLPSFLPPLQFHFPIEASTESVAAREARGQTYLDGLRNQLIREGIRAESHVVIGRNVPRQILRASREQRCDMIVLATHGLSGFDRVLMGSVADQVVRGSSSLPVLILHPRAEVEEPVVTQPEAAAVNACSLPVNRSERGVAHV
jgi:nucleotide-binding universal stress UspA family protein